MVTHYVEDYDGKRNADAAEPLTLEPVLSTEAKVVAAPKQTKPKRSSTAETK